MFTVWLYLNRRCYSTSAIIRSTQERETGTRILLPYKERQRVQGSVVDSNGKDRDRYISLRLWL